MGASGQAVNDVVRKLSESFNTKDAPRSSALFTEVQTKELAPSVVLLPRLLGP